MKNYNNHIGGGKKTKIVGLFLLCCICCWSCLLSGCVGVFGGPQFFQKFTTSYRKITGQYKATKKSIKSKYSKKELEKLALCATVDVRVNEAKKGECCGGHGSCKSKYCERDTGQAMGFCIYDWPRKTGQPCSFHEDCSGYGTGVNDSACCDGTCKKKKKYGFLDVFGSCP